MSSGAFLKHDKLFQKTKKESSVFTGVLETEISGWMRSVETFKENIPEIVESMGLESWIP